MSIYDVRGKLKKNSMDIKHKELLPDKENPFLHCKLDRQKYAFVLTTIIQNYSEGFVLALNGEWGTGKTTFVRMWERSLQLNDYKTIYFNAWENDYENDPLTALLGELKKIINNKNSNYRILLEKGAKISKNIFPAIVKGVISKHIDAGVALEVLEKSVEAATDLLSDEIDAYVNKKQGLIDFKNELEKYIKSNNNGKPVIFIIDELDRCRPNYAVELLEKVKHFFSVQGIVFVLSIDKSQLGNSIQGYYGNSSINKEEYLRRFIDLEYRLPEPNTKVFCEYLYHYYQFKDFFNSSERHNNSYLQGDGERFKNFAVKLFTKYNYTLRQQEKIFAYSRIVLRTFEKDQFVFPYLLILLIHLRERESLFYEKLKKNDGFVPEIAFEFEKIFSKILIEEALNEYSKEFVSAESQLLLFYYWDITRNGLTRRQPELVIKIEQNFELSFKTTIEIEAHKNTLLRFISIGLNSEYYGFELKRLISKIDLIENIS